jgi:hypothetical protein
MALRRRTVVTLGLRGFDAPPHGNWRPRDGVDTSRQVEPRPAEMQQTDGVNTISMVILIVLLGVPLLIVGVAFIWAAIRDGAEDRALQRRLGIRRRTRLGR